MKEVFFSISDSEIGDGSVTEDFWSDSLFIKKLEELDNRHGSTPTYFIINGDGFDFLKVSYKGKFPRYITKEISLYKLDQMYKAHKKLFAALRSYAKKKKNTLIFTYGNHDMDLAFLEVQEKLKKLIHESIVFSGFEFERGVVRFEHGSQHELIFYINPDRLFLPFKGKQILNLPWITYALFEHQSKVKLMFPFIDTIYPRENLNELYPRLRKSISWATTKYFFQSAIVNQVRYFNNITYRLSLRLILHFIYRLLTGEFDVIFEDNLKDYARKRTDLQVIVAGHSHVKKLQKLRKGLWYVNTGAWRDEFYIKKNGRIYPKPKHIAEIVVEDNVVTSVKVEDVPMDITDRIRTLQETLNSIGPQAVDRMRALKIG